ncbi:hypothetical protein DITRI_Ditri05aG0023400 [Diplodiscus trichospermus]
MTTMMGQSLFSNPISISNAAKIIANFAATDNGASQAVSAYLRRTSASFSELKQLHRELRKLSKSDRKHKKSSSEIIVEGGGESSLEPSVFNLPRGYVKLSQEASQVYGDSEKSKHRGKKKKEKGEVINFRDGESKIVIQDGESKRKKEKNEDNFAEDQGKMLIEKNEIRRRKVAKRLKTFREMGWMLRRVK